MMIVIDILSVAGVFYLKFYLTRVIFYKNGDVIAEIVNAVQIQVLATIYSNMGKSLAYNFFFLFSSFFSFFMFRFMFPFFFFPAL